MHYVIAENSNDIEFWGRGARGRICVCGSILHVKKDATFLPERSVAFVFLASPKWYGPVDLLNNLCDYTKFEWIDGSVACLAQPPML